MNDLLKIIFLVILLSLPLSGSAQTPAQVAPGPITDIPLRRLEREITRAAQSAGGTVGMSAIHIETGRRIALNVRERFPMASTYKVPIAVFVKSSEKEVPERERAIAQIARTVYDFFLFQP